MTHDISLPYNQKPCFSTRCVVCESPNPDAIAEVSVLIAIQKQGLVGDVADAILGSSSSNSNMRITLKPSVCSHCKPSLQKYHFWKQIWQYSGPFLGVALFVVFASKNLIYVAVGTLIAGIFAPVIYELIYPPAVNATGSGRNIIYEFRSQLYAQEFAELNQKNDQLNEPVSS
jgi:hypothetical protein